MRSYLALLANLLPAMSTAQHLNVLRTPLTLHSLTPPTGYTRTGYCAVPPSDTGNHSIAARVTKEFLDYTARQGNDLRSAGIKEGCKWCLCASRWKEAFEARGREGDAVVPRVWLSATSEKALRKVDLEDLRKFAVDEGGSGSVSGSGGREL